MDMRLPGMVYAVGARPAVVGGKLRRLNSDKARAVPGMLKVVEIPGFSGAPAVQPLGGVAVVARNTWSAMQGRAAQEIEWDDGPNGVYDSAAFRQTLEAASRSPGKVVRNDGDVRQAWNTAATSNRFAAEYHIPHLAHASMEPPVATVRIQGDRAEVWTSIQNPAVAARLKLKPEQVGRQGIGRCGQGCQADCGCFHGSCLLRSGITTFR